MRRRIAGILFAALIVASIAFGLTPFLVEEAIAATCTPHPKFVCPGHEWPDGWMRYYDLTPDCCCNRITGEFHCW